MNCNRCFICDQPIKKVSMKHFHSQRCFHKLSKLRCSEDDPAFGMWEDAIMYICFFVNYFNHDAKVKTIDFNRQYVCHMDWLHFHGSYE